MEDAWLQVHGWAADHSLQHSIGPDAVLLVKNNGKTHVFGNLERISRPDVAAALQNPLFENSGFIARVSLNGLKRSKNIELFLGFAAGDGTYKTISLGSILPEEWD